MRPLFLRAFLPLAALSSFSLALPSTAQEKTAASETQPHILTVGGRDLKVPNPAGYVRCDGINTTWDQAIRSILPASNRMLATFGTTEDQGKIRDGEPTNYERNFNIQSVRSIENREIGERTFAGMRGEVQKEIMAMRSKLDAEMKRLADQGNKQMSKDFGVDVALSISDTAVLGFFEETDTSIGFTMVMNVGVGTGNEREVSKGIVACLMVPVNGRVVNLYSSDSYQGPEDQKEVESTVKSWRDAILAVNPRVQGPAAGFDFEKLGTFIGIGVGAGLGYALVLWLVKKLRPSKTA
ncbi:MAG TPA: hypothetical protein VGE29_19860 [Prosthecobacter sp.]